jgi:RND family efflux transporter MFP subunit
MNRSVSGFGWVATGAGCLCLGLAAAGCSRTAGAPAGSPQRTVQVAVVQAAALDNSVRAVGLLTPKDEARLSFKIGGLIDSIPVEEGRAVRAGQVLAVLKPAEINASLEQARATTAKARRDLERSQALLADGVATQEQAQDLATAFQVASAAQSAAEFNSTHARIVAAADGVVLRKLAEANEWVQAGQTVLVVGGSGRGWIVRVGLADRDAVRVRLGDSARVEFDAWPGQVFAARVSNIASAADPGTGTFTIELQMEAGAAAGAAAAAAADVAATAAASTAPGVAAATGAGDVHFVQGLVAKVALSPSDARQGRVIPVQALLEANDKEAGVFVLDPATRVVHRVNIQIGRMAQGQIEVRDGLDVGARVVTDGAAFLENGETVRVVSR